MAGDEAIQSYRLPRRPSLRSGLLAMTIHLILNYQLDFFTPGISPLFASSLKHILHNPNFLIKPCLLPHLKQRLIVLLENFGFFFAFASCDVFAMFFYLMGNPNNLNNSIPSSLVFALVVIVTCNPKIIFSFSVKISGKAMCSLNPIDRFPFLSNDFWSIP